ncbi:MAG: class I SAM-dependent methyltransferase family protein [Methanothrix sp.]|uniref:class I SAM-dependent methyltransferase n=1 Tax=Methanothrix sp. TaxID=90426 RepID=UPI00247E1ED0|nr:class I SAM-dependent methyltransferase family protein [Methanothrix sp.]
MCGSKTTLGVKAPRSMGERIRRILAERGALDRKKRIRSDDYHIYIPVLESINPDALKGIAGAEIVQMEFEEDRRKVTVEEILGRKPSFETIGDIAVVEDEEPEVVADAIMAVHRGIRAVLAPVSDVEGEFRLRRYRYVAGEMRTLTVHREHGIRYMVDLERAYFSPRLGTERLRVAEQVRPGDTVVDMFAGVGPFSLLMAKRGARVIAIDKNPYAVKLLVENARMNRLDVEVREGDAAALTEDLADQADHVVMNLPHSASIFLPEAIRTAKSGGVVHYYTFAPEDDLYRDVRIIEEKARELGCEASLLYRGIVRSYAPRIYNVVIDFMVKKDVRQCTQITEPGSR